MRYHLPLRVETYPISSSWCGPFCTNCTIDSRTEERLLLLTASPPESCTFNSPPATGSRPIVATKTRRAYRMVPPQFLLLGQNQLRYCRRRLEVPI